jgi:hypothetical protein
MTASAVAKYNVVQTVSKDDVGRLYFESCLSGRTRYSEILAYLYKDLINVSDSLISKYCTPLFTWNFRNITFGCEYKHISG